MKDYLLQEYMDMPNPEFLFKVSKYTWKRRELIFASHWHEHLELLFFLSGSAMVKCGQRSMNVKPGDLIIVNSNELHSGESLEEELDYSCIIFDLALLKSWAVDACQTKYISPVIQNTILFENIVENNELISQYIHSLISEYEKKDFAYELSIKSTLFGLITYLLRNHMEKELTSKWHARYNKKTNNIKKALRYVETSYPEKITIDMLAEVAGMSRFYFCHSFKEVTGQTISDYINYIRISMAESKLDNTDLSITDIALSVGFDDINYFSRVYKKHKGISPKAARRNLKF
jgi:AraC-like DNA-binding protein